MIKSSNLSKLRQLDLYQVVNDVLTYLKGQKISDMGLSSVTESLTTAFTDYDNVLIQDRKTGMTGPILQLDQQRDELFKGLVQYIQSCTIYPVKEKQAAAHNLLMAIEKYSSVHGLALREETAAITNLIQDISTEQQEKKLETLDASLFAKALQEKNIEFETLYLSRTEKESQIEPDLVKKMRIKVEDAFKKLVQAVNGLAISRGEAEYRALIDFINREINRAHLTAKAKVTARANKKKTT